MTTSGNVWRAVAVNMMARLYIDTARWPDLHRPQSRLEQRF